MDVPIDMGHMNTAKANDDNKGVPEVNGAVPREGQKGNKWHDPGGGKGDTGLQGHVFSLKSLKNIYRSNGSDVAKETQRNDFLFGFVTLVRYNRECFPARGTKTVGLAGGTWNYG